MRFFSEPNYDTTVQANGEHVQQVQENYLFVDCKFEWPILLCLRKGVGSSTRRPYAYFHQNGDQTMAECFP